MSCTSRPSHSSPADLGSIHFGHSLGHADEQMPPQLAVGNRAHQLVPERDGQIGVVLTELLLRQHARLVRMPRTATPLVLSLALDQPGPQQPRQPVANRRAGDTQVLFHLDDGHRTGATDQVQQFSIR